MKKYLLISLSILLLFCSQNSFAQSKKEKQDTTKNQEQPVPIKEYYESGKIKIEGFVKNYYYDSIFTSYYENGQIEAQGSFKDCVFEKNNIQKESFSIDYIGDSLKFIFGKKDGNWNYYYQNGTIKKAENLVCGFGLGTQFEYYPSGNLKRHVFITAQGKLDLEYFENGNIEIITRRIDEYEIDKEDKNKLNLVRITEDIEYEDTGEIWLMEINKEYQDRGKNVKYFEYYKNGVIKEEKEYVNGYEKGIIKNYYENGKMEKYEEVKDNELHGKQYYFDKEGKLIKTETWEKGKLIKTEIPNQE